MFYSLHFFPTQKKYTAAFEDMKDQIYFMQTETPTYASNKKAREIASSVCFYFFFFLHIEINMYDCCFELDSDLVTL